MIEASILMRCSCGEDVAVVYETPDTDVLTPPDHRAGRLRPPGPTLHRVCGACGRRWLAMPRLRVTVIGPAQVDYAASVPGGPMSDDLAKIADCCMNTDGPATETCHCAICSLARKVRDARRAIAALTAAIEEHHRTTHCYDGSGITDALQAEREMWALVGLKPDPDALASVPEGGTDE